MAIEVRLNVYEGPLDLLLQLIEKNKIDIYDIPIVEITDQYMEIVRDMQDRDLGVMSEFMLMAATLLDIKCRMLLPAEENEEGEEEDPRAGLVEQLLEYKMYKYMSGELREQMDEAQGSFFRGRNLPPEVMKYQPQADPAELLEGVTLEKLHQVFEAVLRRQNERIDPIRSRFGKIEKEPLSVSEKLLQIRDYAVSNRTFSFRNLLEKQHSKTAVVVSFLSVLELIKMGHIRVIQEGLFEDIQIQVLDDPASWKNLTEYAEAE